jgi:hypothetical protein
MQSPEKSSFIHVLAEEEPIAIGFDAVAAYHGQAALAMLAITFQGLRASLAALSPDIPPRRNDLIVVSGHPGPGVRDAFEFVTRAVTRNAYTIDRSLPEARLNPRADISYSFRISLGGETVQAALRHNILPQRFFDLVSKNEKTEVDLAEFSALKRQIAATVLVSAPESLFTIKKITSRDGRAAV